MFRSETLTIGMLNADGKVMQAEQQVSQACAGAGMPHNRHSQGQPTVMVEAEGTGHRVRSWRSVAECIFRLELPGISLHFPQNPRAQNLHQDWKISTASGISRFWLAF
jgi:hypothetical protein